MNVTIKARNREVFTINNQGKHEQVDLPNGGSPYQTDSIFIILYYIKKS